jgi:arylsulfatase A-like enzyme
VILSVCLVFVAAPRVEAVKPNVLVILVQDLRASVAESPAWMPKLNEIRKRGVTFANAHAASTVENAARTSVWTGLLPSASGVTVDGQDWRRAIAMTNVRTLPEHFREKGYFTAAGGRVFYSNHGGEGRLLLSADGGGRRGYELDVAWDLRFPGPGVQVPQRSEERPTALAQTEDGQVAAWVKKFLGMEHEKPFFLVAGLGSLALPRQPPLSFVETAKAVVEPLAHIEDVDRDLADVPAFPRNRFSNFRQAPVDSWKDYGAAAVMCDEVISRMITALDASVHAEDTLVLVTSTRGAMLGEKRCTSGGALWEAATRIPLVAFGPGIDEVARPQEQAVSSVDLYPTLCEWVGVPAPSHLSGRSFRRCIGSFDHGADWVVTTMAGSAGSPSYSVRDIDWHYIRYADGSEELYDHQQDRGEQKNFALETITQAERTRLAAFIPPTTVGFSRLVDQVPQFHAADGSTQVRLQMGDVVPHPALPSLPGRGFILDVAFDFQGRFHRDAVLLSWGTREAGLSVHLESGKPVLSLYEEGKRRVTKGVALKEGPVEISVIMAPKGAVAVTVGDDEVFEVGPYRTGFPAQPRTPLLVGRVGQVPTTTEHPRRAGFDGTFQRFNLTLLPAPAVTVPSEQLTEVAPTSAGL